VRQQTQYVFTGSLFYVASITLLPATHMWAVSWVGHINYNKQAHTKWQPTAVR